MSDQRPPARFMVFDADGHVLEPPDLWLEYIDPGMRAQAPELVRDSDGRERFRIGDKLYGGSTGLGRVGGVGRTETELVDMSYAEGRPGGFDPKRRLDDLDLDGIDGVMLYPTLGLLQGAIEEPALAAAVCRAYNRWLDDYCSAAPGRLFGAAMLPLQDPELAVQEIEYVCKHLSLRNGFVRPNPYGGRNISDATHDVVWAAAQDHDFAIGIHEAAGGMKEVGVDRVNGFAARHIVSHTMELMLASLNLIWGGVCERFPRLRLAFLECGGGWMVGWLDRMDRHFDRRYHFTATDDLNLRMRPSDYFARQCWISFEPVEQTIAYAAVALGPNKLMWATDYPHSDGYFPGAPEMIRKQLPPDLHQPVLAGGAIGFYGLDRR